MVNVLEERRFGFVVVWFGVFFFPPLFGFFFGFDFFCLVGVFFIRISFELLMKMCVYNIKYYIHSKNNILLKKQLHKFPFSAMLSAYLG